MADLSSAISQMVILLIIVLIGMLCAKLGYLDDHVKGKLTKLLLNVTLPCMIVASTAGIDAGEAGGQAFWSFLLGAAQFFILLGVGALCNVILRVPTGQRKSWLFMSFLSNTAFIGIPVIAAIYGSHTVLLSSIAIMGLNLFIYSVGFGIVTPKEQMNGAKDVAIAVLNPSTIASLLAIAMLLTGTRLPHVATSALDMVGSTTAPIAMLLVGLIVYQMNVIEAIKEWRLYPYIVIKQLVVPLLVYIVLRPAIPDPLVLGITVVMLGMPVGSMASMFLGSMGHDDRLAAKGTVLSTLGAFITIPLLVTTMAML